jgi:hypothetical protein
MEYTHDEHCDMLLTLGACNSQLVLLHRNARYAILVDVILSLMYFDDRAASPWDRKCNTHGIWECKSPRPVRTPANEGDVFAAVEREP